MSDQTEQDGEIREDEVGTADNLADGAVEEQEGLPGDESAGEPTEPTEEPAEGEPEEPEGD